MSALLVCGALHLDVVVRAPHLPAADETVTGSAVDYVFGGKGGNQAVAAARLGANVHFAGRAGQDGFGTMIRQALNAARVDCRLLQDDDGPSGMSVAIIEDTGEYGAVIVSAANLAIDPAAIDLPEATGLVLLQNEIPEAVNVAIAAKARAAGVPVWLNAAPARALPVALLRCVDLMIVNRGEAAHYGDTPGTEQLITRGAQGVLFRGQAHAAPRVKMLSAHGAGDCFVGALASRVLQGQTIAQALPFAQAAAALHVSGDLAARAGITAKRVRDFQASL